MISIPNLAHSRHAIDQHLARLTGRKLKQRVIAFLSNQLCSATSRAHHLRALTWLQLDVVHRSTGGNIAQRKCIAHQNVGLGTADDLLSDLQAHWLQDVALLAVGICKQGDTRRAVGIVFDRRHGRWNPRLIALEVDDANLAFMSTATMPARDIAGVATPPSALLDLSQRFMRTVRRDLVVDQRGLEPQRRSKWSVCLNRHWL